MNALDYELGKTVGDDFREGKVTLPIIIAYQNGTEDERAFWQRTIGDGNCSDSDLANAQCLLTKYDSLAETGRVAIEHAKAAADALAVFPPNRHRRALEDVAAFCVERAF